MLTPRSRRLAIFVLVGGLVIGGVTSLLSFGIVATYSLELAWFVFMISYFDPSTVTLRWRRPFQAILIVLLIGWVAVVLQALITPS